MNPCEHYEDLLSAQLDEALTAQKQADLNAHLETCPHCRKYAQDLQTLHASLLGMAADPPDWMTGSIMEDLKEAPFSPARKARRWAPLACAAVLALVLLGGTPMLFDGSSSSDTDAAERAEQSTTDSASPGEGRDVTEEIITGKTENPKEEPYTEDMAPGASTESSAALTQEAALAALEDQLAEEGRDLELEPVDLSEDGGSWLFSAKDSAREGVALFSVARDSGVIREIPAAEPIPER